MKRIQILQWLILATTFFFSCKERLAEVEVPMVDAKPVLHAFLSPEEKDIVVYLSMTQPVFGKSSSISPVVSNARVIIRDQNLNVDTLKFDLSEEVYKISAGSYPIKHGYTYTIEAFHSGMGWTVSGTTHIPPVAIPLKSARVSKIESGGESTVRFGFTWDDPGEESNYYRVGGVSYSVNGIDTSRYELVSDFVDDRLDNGKEILVSMETGNYYGTGKFQGYLVTCDKHYYEYQRRRVRYSGDDPFSTPVPMYNNVQGGLGVVSSYRISYRIFD